MGRLRPALRICGYLSHPRVAVAFATLLGAMGSGCEPQEVTRHEETPPIRAAIPAAGALIVNPLRNARAATIA
jgi:hypothetical protein